MINNKKNYVDDDVGIKLLLIKRIINIVTKDFNPAIMEEQITDINSNNNLK